MSPPRISRSPDLQRLRDEGYEIAIRAGYLVMTNVPYVNSRREVRCGTLVSNLTLAGDVTTRPADHVVRFTGEQPCHKDGRVIEQIRHGEATEDLGKGLIVSRSFSNKPKDGYANYFDKMTTYANIIAGPAEALDPSATARTFRASPSEGEEETVFHYIDTATTRAGIGAATSKLEGQRIGIVGVGGTGSYVLDLVAKCPVAEIHVFDGDKFLQHNAFRAPGAPSLEELQRDHNKAVYMSDVYSKMHRRIVPHACNVAADNVAELDDLDFIFVCVDKGTVRKFLVEALEARGKAFVDAGLGVLLDEHAQVGGILRVTTSTPQMRDHFRRRVPLVDTSGNDDYSRNIQIADLNSLTACLAVMKWKKLLGFYRDLDKEHHTTYTIDGHMILGEDKS